MLKTWMLSAALVLTAAACGGAKKGTVPVDSPIYSPPPNDPSAEEPEEKDDGEGAGAKGSTDGAESSLPQKSVNTAGAIGHSLSK